MGIIEIRRGAEALAPSSDSNWLSSALGCFAANTPHCNLFPLDARQASVFEISMPNDSGRWWSLRFTLGPWREANKRAGEAASLRTDESVINHRPLSDLSYQSSRDQWAESCILYKTTYTSGAWYIHNIYICYVSASHRQRLIYSFWFTLPCVLSESKSSTWALGAGEESYIWIHYGWHVGGV